MSENWKKLLALSKKLVKLVKLKTIPLPIETIKKPIIVTPRAETKIFKKLEKFLKIRIIYRVYVWCSKTYSS